MSFIRAKKVGGKIYYSEVENVRVNGKVVQRHLRYIGRDKDSPDHIPLEKVHFGYIATRLMQGDLTPDELFNMIESMGHRIGRENLERIGLFYDFKKNSFSLSLQRRRSSGQQRNARSAEKE
ncbi:hypothetical protein Thermo_01281 [Thermoplasmatales archaeon]|nr:hypothetical protein Thermo_00157 [Thermoplasmatales archaeon]QRF75775.1 hypothetical protein Thermo_01281 [Thermoplasmatales archaeon]